MKKLLSFEEVTDEGGSKGWRDHKSPNGIIPTLRNLFEDHPNGTWIAWRKEDSLNHQVDDRIEMNMQSKFIKLWLLN